MSDKTPLLDEAALATLLHTAPDTSNLAATPTVKWLQRLTERQQWHQQWDTTLATLLKPLEKSNDPFAVKPQRINELLGAWPLGLPADPALAPPNSAALLLKAHQDGANLLPAIAAWGARTLANTDASARHRLCDEAPSITHWLQRWGGKEAEMAFLVPCDGLRVSDYSVKLLRLAASVESSLETLARGALKTSASGSTQSPSQFTG